MTTENLNLELKISLDEVFENPAEIDEKEFKDKNTEGRFSCVIQIN